MKSLEPWNGVRFGVSKRLLVVVGTLHWGDRSRHGASQGKALPDITA